MYNQPFYIPGNYGTIPNLARGAAASRSLFPMNAVANATRGGLFSRLGSAFGAIKALNWSGLINNTSKTLGLINQTIPLVRQVGPMMGNMRSMLKLASVFKDETDSPIKNTTMGNNYSHSSTTSDIRNNYKKEEVQNYIQDNSPNYFLN
jgi:hypothetical protein